MCNAKTRRLKDFPADNFLCATDSPEVWGWFSLVPWLNHCTILYFNAIFSFMSAFMFQLLGEYTT